MSNNSNDNRSSDQLTEHPSTTSLGFGNNENDAKSAINKDESRSASSSAMNLPFKTKNYTQNGLLYDCCLIAIICNQHKRLAMKQMAKTNHCYFLPIVRFDSKIDSIEILFQEFIDSNTIPLTSGNLSKPELIDQLRLKQPYIEKFYTRFILRSIFQPSNIGNCCIDSETIHWMNEKDLKSYLNPSSMQSLLDNIFIWGSEPLFIAFNYTDKNFREEQFQYNNNNNADSINHKLLNEYLNINEQKSLYNEFLIDCYPSETMSFASFLYFSLRTSIINHYNDTNELLMIYRSIVYEKNMGNNLMQARKFTITFQQLVLGLLLMTVDDEFIHHNANNKIIPLILSEKRFQSLFSYYDLDNDGKLNQTEMNNLFKDYYDKLSIHMINGKNIPEWMVLEKQRNDFVQNLMEKYSDSSTNDNAITSSQLELIMNEICFKLYPLLPSMCKVLYCLPFNILSYASMIFNELNFQKQLKMLCRCKQCMLRQQFSLSNQVICLSMDGEINDIIRLEPFSNKSALSFIIDIPDDDIYLLTIDVLVRLQRLSLFLFTNNNVYNGYNKDEIIKQNKEILNNWFFPSSDEMLETIKIIIKTASEIFSNEKRLLRIESPCFVFGDLHGNFNDLTKYSHLFWKCSPFLNFGKYLFLGDYINHGDFSLEVIIYLFCLKILAPNNFFLLRGNHEIRQINTKFYKDCQKRLNLEIWNLFCNCFDMLPLSAIIDDNLFCVHGGLPISATSIAQIEQIPKKLSINSENFPLKNYLFAWELLWNDPIDNNDKIKINKDYCFNYKRNTGLLFGKKIVQQFMAKNSLQYIIRAHEVFPNGLYFYFNGKIISIFSSSNYHSTIMNNTSSLLLIMNNKIRVLKI